MAGLVAVDVGLAGAVAVAFGANAGDEPSVLQLRVRRYGHSAVADGLLGAIAVSLGAVSFVTVLLFSCCGLSWLWQSRVLRLVM